LDIGGTREWKKGGGRMVRVIIERYCRRGEELELLKLLLELRMMAVRQPGYVSGETLKLIGDTSLWLVISTWMGVDQWQSWEANPERRKISSKIEPLLVAPEKVSIFSFIRQGGGESAHTIDR
jgi:antibiotic biosynthesis monooxygenase (ABM) superfamily enzyme